MTIQIKRKRSQSIVLTSLMTGAALTLVGCDDANETRDVSRDSGATVEARAFRNVAECAASAEFTQAQCQAAYTQAQQASSTNAPQFASQQSCEQQFGAANCVQRNNSSGGSFFTPLLTGFLVGQAVSNLTNGGFRGVPMYRDRDGGYLSGSGYPVTRDYYTGRTQMRTDSFDAPRAGAPPRMQSRSSVISRGGFGGWGGRGFGG